MADSYDMRQPEMRAWQPDSVRQGMPGAIGDAANWLYGLLPMVPSGSEMSTDTQRRIMDNAHRLTNALMQTPAGLGLMAHETGTKTADKLGDGEYAKALGTLLGGGAAIAAPFGIGKMFGPGNRDAGIAQMLANAPGKTLGEPFIARAMDPGMRQAGSINALRPNQQPMPPTANDPGSWYPMLVK